jgi:hypothetical protein
VIWGRQTAYLAEFLPADIPSPISSGGGHAGGGQKPVPVGRTHKKTGGATLTLAGSGQWVYDLTDDLIEEDDLIAVGLFEDWSTQPATAHDLAILLEDDELVLLGVL